MPAVIVIKDHWTDGKRLHVTGTVTTSGNYTTGGDTLSFANTEIKSASPPVFVIIQGQGVNNYTYVPGSTMANGLIFGQTGGVQFTTATPYPTDTVSFYAIFPKFI